ncbi:hypothetical protein [Microcoleus sp. herbarium14]
MVFQTILLIIILVLAQIIEPQKILSSAVESASAIAHSIFDF